MTSKQSIKVPVPDILAEPTWRLQFITHHTERYSYLDSVRIALEGGCRWVQLRMKGAEESLLEETAIAAKGYARRTGRHSSLTTMWRLPKGLGLTACILARAICR